jgi:hypothetical protein
MNVIFQFLCCFVVSVPVGLVALTVSQAVIFAELRTLVQAKSSYWGKVINCTFCLSFYVGLMFQLFTLSRLDLCAIPYIGPVVNSLLGLFTVIAMSSITAGTVYKMYSTMSPIGSTGESAEFNDQIELMQDVENWMAAEQQGGVAGNQSARAMVQLITGIPLGVADTILPVTPVDMAACKRALDLAPSLRKHLAVLEEFSPEWTKVLTSTKDFTE